MQVRDYECIFKSRKLQRLLHSSFFGRVSKINLLELNTANIYKYLQLFVDKIKMHRSSLKCDHGIHDMEAYFCKSFLHKNPNLRIISEK